MNINSTTEKAHSFYDFKSFINNRYIRTLYTNSSLHPFRHTFSNPSFFSQKRDFRNQKQICRFHSRTRDHRNRFHSRKFVLSVFWSERKRFRINAGSFEFIPIRSSGFHSFFRNFLKFTNWTDYWRPKIFSLLIPYLGVSFLAACIKLQTLPSITEYLNGILLGSWCAPYYFVPLLVSFYLMFPFFKRILLKSNSKKVTLIFFSRLLS